MRAAELTREDKAFFVNISHNIHQCRRCINELMALNDYLISDDTMRARNEAVRLLEDEISREIRMKRDKERAFWGEDVFGFTLDDDRPIGAPYHDE